jgi:hypothetical protein
MKKIYWFLLLALLGVGYVASTFLQNPQINTSNQVAAIAPVPAEIITAHSSTRQANSSIQVAAPTGRKLTATEIAVKSDWMRRSGRSSSEREAYRGYSDEQLMSLIEQGDINAMYVMGERKLDSEGTQAAIPFAQKEIVYGSLTGISTMAIYLEPDFSSDLPIEDLKKQLMESQAYYYLYSMRGDKYSSNLFKETQVKIFQTAYKIDKVFTAEDEAWIENRAKELYDYYQAERNKLGLGDFDNEVPKEVKTFFGE